MTWRLRSFVHSSRAQRSYRTLTTAARQPGDWTNAFVSYDESRTGDASSSRGPLRDVRVALKDNICTRSFKTTCSSAMLEGEVIPRRGVYFDALTDDTEFVSPYDATVVRLLRGAGAHIVGKTNCDEFGMGSCSVHSVHGPVLNPYEAGRQRERRSAGGSSGGSAAAVASGSCFAALGTDTGGSTRLPAAYCGIAGLKPSYGLISRSGVVSYADSLDCLGILAKEATHIQPILDVLAVHDPNDPTSIGPQARIKAAESLCSHTSLHSLVVGIPQEYFPQELDQSAIEPLRKLVQALKSAGASVVPVSLPSTPYALSAYYVIASAEASSNLAKYSGIHYGSRVAPPPKADTTKVSNVYSYTRSKRFGREVQKRILLGTYALTADAFDNYFLQAQRIRNLIKHDFNSVFRTPSPLACAAPSRHSGVVDVLLHPSAVRTAPLISETDNLSTLDEYLQDVLTVPASLAGLPALSVPAGLGRDGWPLGVSIVGQWGHDELVLKVGSMIEQLVKS